MSLDAILETIRASGLEQVQEIDARAQAQADKILAEARQEAQRIKAEACAEAAAPAVRERARILQQAHLEVIRITGDARETLVDEAIEQARARLVNIREENRYPAVLRRLALDALSDLAQSAEETSKVRLEADPRDRERLEIILQEIDLDLQRNYDLQCAGGLAAKSEDGRVAVINTLEARLERGQPYLRRYLAALFEERWWDADLESSGTGHND